MSRAGAALLVLALSLSACGGFPAQEWDDLTASTGAVYCPTDDGACSPSDVPSPVIIEIDAGSGVGGHESIVMDPATIAGSRGPEHPRP